MENDDPYGERDMIMMDAQNEETLSINPFSPHNVIYDDDDDDVIIEGVYMRYMYDDMDIC